MIDRQRLLNDLKPVLKATETDLRARCDEEPDINAGLKAEYDQACAADRTGVTFEEWRADLITQVAVGWVLSCVFVRFLEDNHLITPPRISGPLHGAGVGGGLQRARDEREQYFRSHPKQTDRDYLLSVFDALGKLPGTKDVFGPHNTAMVPAYRNWLSGDAAQKLIEFFQKIDADGTGEIVHDFTDDLKGSQGGGWDTRFLGDLYQDLSEAARKKYALLQTPIFVEEFIIDRTLEPAIQEFGLKSFKLIDPACGSGHFLLGGFARLLRRWRQHEPATSDRELILRALASVHGVDLNPFAIAIARFRLLIAVLRECRITKLSEAPAFKFNLVVGDSLLHGKPMQQSLMDFHELAHAYQAEDLPELERILAPGSYHAVVANPPYITVKDKALNQAYRERYSTCFRKYHLSVPFFERICELAYAADGSQRPGSVGIIMDDQFMHQQFGEPFVETFLSRIELTHVISTAGAYLPGHGTPTVIMFARNGPASLSPVRAVMGIRGEPSTPEDPARGQVWTSILEHVDIAGSGNEFVSVSDLSREVLAKHPWSLGGGGASELKEAVEANASTTLGKLAQTVGYGAIVGNDDIFVADRDDIWLRKGIGKDSLRLLTSGEQVRDWRATDLPVCLFPYAENGEFLELPDANQHFWQHRTGLRTGLFFGGSKEERGKDWRTFAVLVKDKLFRQDFIVYASVATHAQFGFVQAGAVSSQSGPAVLLPLSKGYDEYAVFLAAVNTSVACFWLKQVCHNKGSTVDQHGARQRTDPFEDFFDFSATRVKGIPLPEGFASVGQIGRAMLSKCEVMEANSVAEICRGAVPDRAKLVQARELTDHLRGQMIALQEELDWQCYRLYGLLSDDSAEFCKAEGTALKVQDRTSAVNDQSSKVNDGSSNVNVSSYRAQREGAKERPRTRKVNDGTSDVHVQTSKVNDGSSAVHNQSSNVHDRADIGAAGDGGEKGEGPTVPPIALGQRAFEIVLARLMAAGEVETTWFTRHGSTPITEIPQHWPADYRAVVQRRIDLIESDRNIGLIEKPEYKRRWNTEPWDEQQARALKGWLLDRLESYFDLDGRMNEAKTITAAADLREPRLTSVAKTADLARADKDFMQVAEIYAGRMDFDVAALVAELMTAESVPALPILRYKKPALDKRAAWERTWELQRLEDAVDAVFDVERLKKVGKAEPEKDLEPVVQRLPIAESAKERVLREVVHAAIGVALAVEQKLDLSSETILKPVHDAAKRAKKAAVGDIPVPPKYTSADFLNSNYWRLRGKLDVPKERWVSFPHCEGEDGSLVIAWAGYDHLQLARAIAERYELAKESEGRKLVPLLAAIGGLIPWLKQWHNEVDPAYGMRMGDYFAGYLAEEAKALCMSVAQVLAWTPPEKAKRAGRKAAATTEE